MNRRQCRDWMFDLLAGLFTVREIPGTLDYLCRGARGGKGLYIPKEVSPTHPGDFNPDITPVATLVYDWFDDPAWRELWVVKGSQGGLSQAWQNLLCKINEYQLGDSMTVLESLTKSKDIGNERFKEMFRANLRCYIPKEDERDQLQNRCLKINGNRNHLAGARTAGGVASRTLRFGGGDEIDEWLNELMGMESNVADLFRERFKLVEDAKLLFFSKPRNAIAPELEEEKAKLKTRKKQEDGIIWNEFLTGSRHYCFVPCLRCGEMQPLTWKQVKFNHCRNHDGTTWDFSKILAETKYECINCQQLWDEDWKVEAILKHRQWRPTNDAQDPKNKFPPVPRKMSAHVSDLYTNSHEFPTLTLGQLALKCVTAETTSARRAFRRGTLGLPVELKIIEKVDLKKIRRLLGKHLRGQCPATEAFACLQIDVQEHGDLFKWVTMAFTMTDDCYILNYGFTRNPKEFVDILAQPITRISAVYHNVMAPPETPSVPQQFFVPGGWIDEGDGLTTNAVLDLCLTQGLYRRLSTCKGRAGRQADHMSDRVDLQKNRTHKGRPIDRYLVDHEYFMDELYEESIDKWSDHLLKLEQGKETAAPSAPRTWFPADADDEFLSEFCSEEKCWHVRLGKMVFGWPLKPEGGLKNDFSDCVKDGRAMWFRKKQKLLKALAEKAAASQA